MWPEPEVGTIVGELGEPESVRALVTLLSLCQRSAESPLIGPNPAIWASDWPRQGHRSNRCAGSPTSGPLRTRMFCSDPQISRENIRFFPCRFRKIVRQSEAE